MDIELVSTKDLVAELQRRSDHCVVVLMNVDEGGKEVHHYGRFWAGNSHTCIGLCWDAATAIKAAFDRQEVVEEQGQERATDE